MPILRNEIDLEMKHFPKNYAAPTTYWQISELPMALKYGVATKAKREYEKLIKDTIKKIY